MTEPGQCNCITLKPISSQRFCCRDRCAGEPDAAIFDITNDDDQPGQDRSEPIHWEPAVLSVRNYEHSELARFYLDLADHRHWYALFTVTRPRCTNLEGPPVIAAFEGENVFAIMNQHVSQDLPSILQCNPDISPALATVVMRAIHRDPEKRYQSMRDMLYDLQHLDQITPVPYIPEISRPGKRYQRAVFLSLVIIAICLTIIAFGLLAQRIDMENQELMELHDVGETALQAIVFSLSLLQKGELFACSRNENC